MKIGCLQFSPQLGEVKRNLSRADATLAKVSSDDLESLDLLVVPELAFSGSGFQSLSHVSPLLEYSDAGITALWARTLALKNSCTVVIGYPEKAEDRTETSTTLKAYNSAIIINREGNKIGNYRKRFLHSDESWASEGDRFSRIYIPGLRRTTLGLSMDINPYKFKSPLHGFEFAYHILDVRSNVVIISMAWYSEEDPETFRRQPQEPDFDTLSYWIQRLEPIIRAEVDEEIIVIFCNRSGVEGDVAYAGTSAVVGIKDGEVCVYGLLGRGQNNVLFVDTDKEPIGKLVYRPFGCANYSAGARLSSKPKRSNKGQLQLNTRVNRLALPAIPEDYENQNPSLPVDTSRELQKPAEDDLNALCNLLFAISKSPLAPTSPSMVNHSTAKVEGYPAGRKAQKPLKPIGQPAFGHSSAAKDDEHPTEPKVPRPFPPKSTGFSRIDGHQYSPLTSVWKQTKREIMSSVGSFRLQRKLPWTSHKNIGIGIEMSDRGD